MFLNLPLNLLMEILWNFFQCIIHVFLHLHIWIFKQFEEFWAVDIHAHQKMKNSFPSECYEWKDFLRIWLMVETGRHTNWKRIFRPMTHLFLNGNICYICEYLSGIKWKIKLYLLKPYMLTGNNYLFPPYRFQDVLGRESFMNINLSVRWFTILEQK